MDPGNPVLVAIDSSLLLPPATLCSALCRAADQFRLLPRLSVVTPHPLTSEAPTSEDSEDRVAAFETLLASDVGPCQLGI